MGWDPGGKRSDFDNMGVYGTGRTRRMRSRKPFCCGRHGSEDRVVFSSEESGRVLTVGLASKVKGGPVEDPAEM